ncbi:amino acid ABC transporter permease [Rhizobium sp. ICMP 5592]|uniref:amino acid ABC transporter permease n=1 Tax=Rhizobium sp. ICMP 5592 TaxID=2292445 RepID=UPI0012970B1D|nr:amino acid ABC transporter permease [Rhizobium sp. ICMP 5592]MQB46115.1 amino acid ABC transporter permease [Rhizobium sp. ICMP 5592]
MNVLLETNKSHLADRRDDDLIFVRRRNYIDIIGWPLCALVVLGIVGNMVTNPRWKWDVIGEYLFSPAVLLGVLNTIRLTLCCGAAGVVFGLIIAFMRLSGSSVLRSLATAYIGFVRAMPALVLILLLYFAAALFPSIDIGLPFLDPWISLPTNQVISKFGAAFLGLTIVMSGHCAEIFRAGLAAVPRGQMEAAKALSLTGPAAYTKVILPQAIRVAIPAFATELISLFKNTSLVTVIGYAELLTVVQNIYGRTYETLPMLMVACIWYLALTIVSMFGQSLLEKRYGRGFNVKL